MPRPAAAPAPGPRPPRAGGVPHEPGNRQVLPGRGGQLTPDDVKTPRTTLWGSLGRQRLVQVAMISGDLLAEPLGRLERERLLLRGKLDLGYDQALQIAGVDVDLDLETVVLDHVPALVEPATLGQRP